MKKLLMILGIALLFEGCVVSKNGDIDDDN